MSHAAPLITHFSLQGYLPTMIHYISCKMRAHSLFYEGKNQSSKNTNTSPPNAHIHSFRKEKSIRYHPIGFSITAVRCSISIALYNLHEAYLQQRCGCLPDKCSKCITQMSRCRSTLQWAWGKSFPPAECTFEWWKHKNLTRQLSVLLAGYSLFRLLLQKVSNFCYNFCPSGLSHRKA